MSKFKSCKGKIFTTTKKASTRFGQNWVEQSWNKALAKFRSTGEKKTLSRYGKIDIAKNHVYSEAVQGYQISPYMQEKMVLVAQGSPYQESAGLLEQLLGVAVSVMQLHRVTNTYGEMLEKQKIESQLEEVVHQAVGDVKSGEVVYAQADGSMILTREEKWKEVKAGRIFKQSDCLCTGDGRQRGWIKQSEYEACLGNSKKFTARFEQQLEIYRPLGERLMLVSDGAPWIKNWIDDTFPCATQVLDWYHCKQHLCGFAEQYFADKEQRESWVEQQTGLLYESQTGKAIGNIRMLPVKNKKQRKSKEQLLQYYTVNAGRMDYKRYRQTGAGIIGSGAIEAAHRHVIQKRMKLSGQRWSKKKAQYMLNLRTTKLSGHWNKIVQMISSSPIKKAA